MSKLTYLNMSLCENITDECLKELAQISSLVDLNLTDCLDITDKGLMELQYMSNLTSPPSA